eukprot:Skav212267  [mRNA]  locus=scaffold732:106781:108271:- [translate_table: standard]
MESASEISLVTLPHAFKEMMKYVVPGWARPRQVIGKEALEYKLFATEGEPCLFKQHVSPRDIQQGYLGDCWMVSSFSALAEYPDRVRALFKQKELSADGRRSVLRPWKGWGHVDSNGHVNQSIAGVARARAA